jgi:hypothetical protein
MLCPSVFHLTILIILGREYRILKFLIKQLSPTTCYFNTIQYNTIVWQQQLLSIIRIWQPITNSALLPADTVLLVIKPAGGIYTFLFGKGIENHELGRVFFFLGKDGISVHIYVFRKYHQVVCLFMFLDYTYLWLFMYLCFQTSPVCSINQHNEVQTRHK